MAKAFCLAGHIPGAEERDVPGSDDVRRRGHRPAASAEGRQLYVVRTGYGREVSRCLAGTRLSRHMRPLRTCVPAPGEPVAGLRRGSTPGRDSSGDGARLAWAARVRPAAMTSIRRHGWRKTG